MLRKYRKNKLENEINDIFSDVLDVCRNMSDGSVVYNLDLDFGFGNGTCSDLKDVNVGVSGVLRHGEVSDEDFTYVAVVLFHECRHVQQNGFGYDPAYPVSPRVSMSNLAREDNYFWYRQNYSRMPFEIEAERYALKKAWGYLDSVYEDAEELVLNHVNERMLGSGITYFIPKKPDGTPYRSMGEVFRAFDDALLKSFQEPRVYPAFAKVPFGDDVYDGMCRDRDDGSEWLDLYVEMNAIVGRKTPGWRTDEMIASYELFLHPEYKERYPDLPDLDPMEICGRPFPESREEVLEHIRNVRDGMRDGGRSLKETHELYSDEVARLLMDAEELEQDCLENGMEL